MTGVYTAIAFESERTVCFGNMVPKLTFTEPSATLFALNILVFFLMFRFGFGFTVGHGWRIDVNQKLKVMYI